MKERQANAAEVYGRKRPASEQKIRTTGTEGTSQAGHCPAFFCTASAWERGRPKQSMSVRRTRTPFNRPSLFEEHVSEVGDGEGEQLCLLFLGSKENKVDDAFGHSRCQVGNVDLLLPLNVLLNQIIDLAVQAALRCTQ